MGGIMGYSWEVDWYKVWWGLELTISVSIELIEGGLLQSWKSNCKPASSCPFGDLMVENML